MPNPEVPETTPAGPPSQPMAAPADPAQAATAELQQVQPATGPIGQVRGTGVCMLLTLVTLGIYALVWYYQVHDEMKRHSAEGLGGPLALVLAFFIGIASPFLTSSEVGKLYERRGESPPVSATTGLWYVPGIFILVGPFIWFAKTNGALNNYWRSLGAS